MGQRTEYEFTLTIKTNEEKATLLLEGLVKHLKEQGAQVTMGKGDGGDGALPDDNPEV